MVIHKFDEDQDPPPAYDSDEEYDLYLYIPSISSGLIPVEGSPEISLEVDNYGAVGAENSNNVLPAYQPSSGNVDTRNVSQVAEREVDSPYLRVGVLFVSFAPCQLTVL
jgi:hypothetical protein